MRAWTRAFLALLMALLIGGSATARVHASQTSVPVSTRPWCERPARPSEPVYSNGYVSYSNEAGQAVNPATGQTIGKSDPMWHWPWGP